MKKILKSPNYQNHQGYSGLNMDAPLAFSSSVGHVVPVDWDFLQPGDKIRLGCHLRTRTTPLISAAMANIEENVRWFFVPMSQIYKPFEQTFNGIQDFGSDWYSSLITNHRISDSIPSIKIGVILDRIKSLAVTGSYPEIIREVRLLESIGIPMQTILQESFVSSDADATWRNHSINLLPLLAYHKVWFDYFRDTDRIPNDPQYYNADSCVDASILPNWLSNGRIDKIMTLHNAPCIKDVMNNVFVSPLFGETGIGGDEAQTLATVNNWLTNASPNVRNASASDNIAPTQVAVANASSTVFVTTASLRSAFATEKLLEITRRARKHFDAQILAHFGVKVPMGVDGEAIEIGHHKQQLMIGDVVATANTYDEANNTGAMLGEIGGKGFGSDGNGGFDFEAKTHGVLICVYYARPSYYYYQQGIDKKLAYSKVSDFPRPEFENLGMQPVFFFNRQLTNNSLVNSFILNWEYRYSEVKTKMPRAILGLSRTLDSWIVGRSPRYGENSSPSGQNYGVETFYVQPQDINQILEVPYSERDWLTDTETTQNIAANNDVMFASDPLIHELSLSYLKSSKISTYGLSEL